VPTANPTIARLDEGLVRSDLRRKLEWLLKIRREAAEGRVVTRREAQELAAAYPGALRELDDTPLESLEERLGALADETLPPWALPTWLYHATLRELLEATRRGLRPRGALVDIALATVAEQLALTTQEVSALALPHARRRTHARPARRKPESSAGLVGRAQPEDDDPPPESDPPPFEAPDDE